MKFADADLIGYPVQVTVGKRGIANGTVDLKLRSTGERSNAPLAEAAQAVVALLATRTVDPAPGALRGASAILTFVQSDEVCPEVGSRPPSRT